VVVSHAASTGKVLSDFKKKNSGPEHYGIDNFKLEILQRSKYHGYFLTALKYFFACVSMGVACLFYK
jgi:hypothetical protein